MAPLVLKGGASWVNSESRVIAVIFLSLVLDLFAFTAILPVFFPAVQHYAAAPGSHDGVFGTLASTSEWFREFIPVGFLRANDDKVVYVGGLLGSLFSLLQFITSPMLGIATDRYGRRPMALLCTAGSFISYVYWLFAGDFEIFLLSRLVGGATRGMIQLATAMVADVTDVQTRTKGLAVVGMAFSVGFTIGPGIGAALARVQLPPEWKIATVHPFAAVAFFSVVMASLNLILLFTALPETQQPQPEQPIETKQKRTKAVPVKDDPLLFYVQFIHIVYIFFFSGLEFTLTYLTLDRFQFLDSDNGRLLAFIGIVSALIQGGYLRRVGPKIGESSVALQGIFFLICGLLVLAFAYSSELLYVGTALFAFASATVVSCLTSLASILCQPFTLGATMGKFRAGGQLGRALGPAAFSALYWARGGRDAYLVGAIGSIIPLLMVAWLDRRLTQRKAVAAKKEEPAKKTN